MKILIHKVIENILSELNISNIDFLVEHPTDFLHGDYATNVAMIYAQKVKKNPHEIATQLCNALRGQISHIEKVEVAGPGFINFYLDRSFFKEKTREICHLGSVWGNNALFKDEEIIFEYTSPNLFKPLHIGNLVGNIVGESISRLFEAGGARLHRVNYPSDIGLTVAKGVWGLRHTGNNPRDINELGDAYRIGSNEYDLNPIVRNEIINVNQSLYDGSNNQLNLLREQGIKTSRTHLTELCRMLGTTFDTEIFESEVSESGTKIVREHVGNVFEESEGAVIYRGEKHGLHTRVFLNSQGLPTYEAKDVGNFAKKQEKYPHWAQMFVVTGGEQREYFKVLVSALREVFPEAKEKIIEHIPTGFLTLTTGKMSSRKGNVLTGESLLEEVQEEARNRALESRAENLNELTETVAVGALKYQILRQSVGSDIVFDKERALSLEGDSGPYLMYTHARIVSIEAKAKDAGIIPNTDTVPDVPYDIEKLVYQFPEIILKAQQERAPHHIIVFLTELSSSFNAFYAHEKFVDTEDSFAPYKLALAGTVRVTLKNGLWVLGIKAPNRM